ncbi:MAG: hypothetical protein Q8O37_03035 [Sulfuricellaceae bacterium]|nr:hypothetical protein [Sulfuricellaceae bacterium]
MRTVDRNLAIAVRNHWCGVETPGIVLCPLLADLDRLLKYLDETGIKPGCAIMTCPECGEYHRWVLLNELMIFALDIRPDNKSRLMEMVDSRLDEVRAMYGGDEGYLEMKKEAEAFFAKVGAGRSYTP